MQSTVELFELMRKSPMNDWVGGTDPESVGDASAHYMRHLLPITNDSRILDFGCGIGRGLASLRKTHPLAEIVGMDIMPPVIDFCRSEIATRFSNTKFELIDDSNDHYDQFIGNEVRKPKAQLSKEYASHFTDGYAFSVFTHVTKEDFGGLLKFISSMMVPGGRFLMTCFELNRYSRHMIEQGQSVFPFEDHVFEDGGDVLIGHKDDPLAFIAFDRQLIEKMVWDAGMAITKVEYGGWMGGGVGSALQDMMICTKLPELVAKDKVKFAQTVDRRTVA